MLSNPIVTDLKFATTAIKRCKSYPTKSGVKAHDKMLHRQDERFKPKEMPVPPSRYMTSVVRLWIKQMARKRHTKKTGRFKIARDHENLIKRIARNKKRLKDIAFQQAAKGILAQFSSRGGNLTERQWAYLKVIDRAPLYRKPRTPKLNLDEVQPSVYAIASRKYIKIGKSVSVQKRLASIQTGNPETLRVLCQEECETHQQALDREQSLHKHFA